MRTEAARKRDRTSIYLVIWFGIVKGKLPPKYKKMGSPTDASQMLKLVNKNAPAPISNYTKIFVLDVSIGIPKPKSKPKKSI